jgi:hypothetical protein
MSAVMPQPQPLTFPLNGERNRPIYDFGGRLVSIPGERAAVRGVRQPRPRTGQRRQQSRRARCRAAGGEDHAGAGTMSGRRIIIETAKFLPIVGMFLALWFVTP